MNNNLILESRCVEKMIKIYIANMESISKKEDKFYFDGINAMEKIDLSKITEEEVKNVIERFLFKWGNMTRLGYSEKGWGKKLNKVIKDFSKDLRPLRDKNLIDENLNHHGDIIKKCYEALRDNVFNNKKTKQKVAASKILHLIRPDFFPPWDNAIIDAYWAEVEDQRKKKIVRFSGEDYYNFMQTLKNFIKENNRIFLTLYEEHKDKKPLLKIVDEFLWFATNRPLFLFVKEKDG